jgi:hypothetical protein
VGIIYNQAKDGKGLEATQEFFRNVFRDDESFRSFPTNTIFSPDWFGYLDAMQDFLCEPQNYRNAFVPRKMMEYFLHTMSGLRDRKNWKHFSEGDFNRWTLNHAPGRAPGFALFDRPDLQVQDQWPDQASLSRQQILD